MMSDLYGIVLNTVLCCTVSIMFSNCDVKHSRETGDHVTSRYSHLLYCVTVSTESIRALLSLSDQAISNEKPSSYE